MPKLETIIELYDLHTKVMEENNLLLSADQRMLKFNSFQITKMMPYALISPDYPKIKLPILLLIQGLGWPCQDEMLSKIGSARTFHCPHVKPIHGTGKNSQDRPWQDKDSILAKQLVKTVLFCYLFNLCAEYILRVLVENVHSLKPGERTNNNLFTVLMALLQEQKIKIIYKL